MEDKRKKQPYNVNTIREVTSSLQISPPINKTIILVSALTVSCITFLVYLPSLHNNFVNWDDDLYVYGNLGIQSIDPMFLKWAFTNVVGANWHPITLFSHALDYAIWELDPWGHHLTNAILHTCNTFLIFILVVWLLERKTPAKEETYILNKKILVAGFVASLLFGIHPLHVESVAWISERKDVLCAFFFLLSILTYLKYTSSAHIKKNILYGATLFFFAMALMSKPMAVTFPIVLIILDFYPLERLAGKGRLQVAKVIILEKIPFFFFSFLSSLVTIWAQYEGGALSTLEAYSLNTRVFVAIRAYSFYLYKMILPLNLAPLYPYPKKIDFFTFEYLGSLILLIIISIIIILSLKRYKLVSISWFYYIVTLLPVIGIIQVGAQPAADRYTYLPSLGPFILAGVGAGIAAERYSKKYLILIVISIVLVSSIMANKTIQQISIWKDSITLWSNVIKSYPDTSYIAYNSRGIAYSNLGYKQKAVEDFTKAIEINPWYVKAYNDRGIAYYGLGYNQQAVENFTKAIEINPKYVKAYNDRGTVYQSLGNYRKAIEDFNKTIEINPEDSEYYFKRGTAYQSLGDYRKAITDFNKTIEINPQNAKAFNNRGVAFYSLGNHRQALEDFKKAVEINPQYEDAYYNLGLKELKGIE